ncbi:hypothetical protein BST27_25785 [Mycobacterium intermedium]|uniref:Isoprenylcysteine carboxyl methyltransferase n=1 Tax=Mycobacterium intermedium TaxID=28445 RepID=A0A1E3S869_MYCIE|nr:methyltransferase [Mycobacterium intermedium]MCV6965220.1 DUF1295 domain-containing protein [Mycobacterium intermedium]ODQ97832.1 hypothetical protein BHQ20_24855 [Mycobacterium intermedium]OPE47372.1 hypothetical protein BV508_22375 [Mycobacterium intermedium]ORA96389.1 hypothetical protein BST27_25785 [Mycobacterium intermedium]
MKTALQALASGLIGLLVLAAILFVPAGTANYWQAWVFVAVFTLGTIIPSLYLGRTDPDALRRRMRGGPWAEARTAQQVIIVAAFAVLFVMMALSALDHRFGWSSVPAAVSVVGDVLVVTGLVAGVLVVVQNSYAAANITVEAGQTVTSDGLYGIVRHPMYAANLFLMTGIPLALGSYWGLLLLVPGVLVLVARILDEEKLLTQELAGYREYRRRVRYRLVPYVW